MSKSEIRTTLLHLRDSDAHDDQKLLLCASFRIQQRNLADETGGFPSLTWTRDGLYFTVQHYPTIIGELYTDGSRCTM